MKNTQIQHTTALSDAQAAAVRTLEHACQEHRPCPGFPWEEYTDVWLLSDSDTGELCAVLAAIDDEETTGQAECIAYTSPELRRQGCFTKLVYAAADFFEDTDMLFPVQADDAGSRAALLALEAEEASTEYRMEKQLSPLEPHVGSAGDSGDSGTDPDAETRQSGAPELSSAPVLSMKAEEDGDMTLFSFFLSSEEELPLDRSDSRSSRPCGAGRNEDSSPAAVCRAIREDTAACFYDFEVSEHLRGKGLGKQALAMVLAYLAERGILKLFLHVSGDNVPAVRLYESAGFHVTESLVYYLF